VKKWQTAITTMDNWLFNGSEAAIASLYSGISDGKVWETNASPVSSDTIEALCETAIFASLIPMTWQLSTQGLSPL
jgi:hypothetical protein